MTQQARVYTAIDVGTTKVCNVLFLGGVFLRREFVLPVFKNPAFLPTSMLIALIAANQRYAKPTPWTRSWIHRGISPDFAPPGTTPQWTARP